jgi:outer membrane protein TolC
MSFKNLAVNFLLILLFLSSISSAQQLLTLEEAIEIALKNNYSIQIARNEKEIADNNSNIGNAGFLPELDASASYEERVTDTKQRFLDGREIDRIGAESENLNYLIELNWTIFDGLEMFAALDRLKELNKLGETNLKAEVENNIGSIISAYYNIVREEKVLDVIRRNIEISEERVSVAESEKDVGTGSKFELLQAQVDLNEDKSTLLQEELNLSNSKTLLNQLLGRDASMDFTVKDTIEINYNLSFDEIHSDIVENNSLILQAQQNINLSKIESRLAHAEWFPEINFYSGYNFLKSTSQAGFVASNRNSGYYYGLAASINLFNGLNTRFKIENAEIQINNSELLYKQAVNNVEAEFLNIFRKYSNSIQLVRLETENLAAAQENVEIAVERLRLGNITPLEFRESQTDLLEAQSRLVGAQYEAKTAETDLLRLSGQIVNQHYSF